MASRILLKGNLTVSSDGVQRVCFNQIYKGKAGTNVVGQLDYGPKESKDNAKLR